MTSVSPESFELVMYDATEIGRVFDAVLATVPGLPEGLDASIAVKEDAPTTRAWIDSLDPLTLTVESGSLENTRAPRTFGEESASATFARLLLECRDRLDPDFGAPPLDSEIDYNDRIAWHVYCYGRATRLGHRVFKPRYLYDFRNRHGFTDAADANYEMLWSADHLTWSDISGLAPTP